MKIALVTPSPAGSTSGNRVTALRWARLLRGLGHQVTVEERWSGAGADLLVALHAVKSARSIRAFRAAHPSRPVVLALTGTDVYGHLGSAVAQGSLRAATRVVVLQALALRRLSPAVRARARVIHQSVDPPRPRPRPLAGVFEVCVLAHLRRVKDPLRAGLAALRLPPTSRVRVVHFGAALEPALARAAMDLTARTDRYRWWPGVPRPEALRRLARARLFVLSSLREGGANALGEAIACGVPVLASRIPGSVGLLGPGYPGYFPPRDTRALAGLLERGEREPGFRGRLSRWCRARAALFRPAREQAAWRRLLREVAHGRTRVP